MPRDLPVLGGISSLPREKQMMAQEPVAWDCSPASAPVNESMHPTAREAGSLSGLSHVISKATPVWDFVFSLEDLL